jgi:hypothetical protein
LQRARVQLKKQERAFIPNLPVPHGPGIPVPLSPEILEDIPVDSDKEDTDSDQDFQCDTCSTEPEVLSQSEPHDLIRDLGLPKDSTGVLGSRLKSKNLLSPGTSFSWYRNREKEFIPYVSQDGDLVYCSDVFELMGEFNIQYDVNEWRFFIVSSKRSFKAVLLHNDSKYVSVPVGHSVHLKESYKNLALVLTKLNSKDHGCMICVDLKVLSTLLGQQSGYTKYLCFLYQWDSRAKSQRCTRKQWPSRVALKPGDKNVVRDSLIDQKKM